eukprot:CAMPEP_0175890698 /NCGR_PEP_ID=MMETSP0107_2-20121207/47962_1 /TAXON_ID=195067 ORGANISM="Goniomonas pacifica, Strain CCMP1869" /NCGR_SAMPLE_ID=MMETSP0107_2 /ASSEMBLY_ACC=CAM_ASM_000203 /LENGTH=122 /DNA_ID=CAMNT_0017211471 /DNA_START=86 /DNA_END=454 /DNA_ORIENTATION=-
MNVQGSGCHNLQVVREMSSGAWKEVMNHQPACCQPVDQRQAALTHAFAWATPASLSILWSSSHRDDNLEEEPRSVSSCITSDPIEARHLPGSEAASPSQPDLVSFASEYEGPGDFREEDELV